MFTSYIRVSGGYSEIGGNFDNWSDAFDNATKSDCYSEVWEFPRGGTPTIKYRSRVF